jgi:hypothetical protein
MDTLVKMGGILKKGMVFNYSLKLYLVIVGLIIILTSVLPTQSMQWPPWPVASNSFASKKHLWERPLQLQGKHSLASMDVAGRQGRST